MENGYSRREVQNAMKETPPRTENKDDEEEGIRGIVSIPNIPTFTRTFSRIAKQHNFRTTTRAENKVKDISLKAKTPLGGKNTKIVYNIPCGCEKFSYTGETDRKWETREKEHMDKVRLTQVDLENRNVESATVRMNTGDVNSQ